ncbi:MAG: serine/threonine-protein kinase [Pirellulales bacterium]
MQRLCSKCNSPVSSDGSCQACLLQLGLSHPGSASADQPWARTLPSIEEIASQFPQLEIKRLIGRGGMGAIYLARQTALDREVALKIIAKEVSDDPMFVERFEREAKTLAKLSHPNIVTVYDFGRTQSGMAYLIMEFVDGVNLREALATKSVGAEDALSLIATMCQALDYAHSKGVVHRDIKPENILLGEDGSLKIADFGIAKIVDESKRAPTLTATRQVLGSLHYLAPEQIESPEQVDHRVDLYALGVIFYELLTGQLPLGNFEPPSSITPRVDKRVDAIVLKTLSRRPAHRYQNASQLKSDIDQINSSHFVQASALPVSGNEVQSQIVSVPFHMETFGGLGKIYGSLQATGTTAKIEYRMTDGIFGSIKSQLYTLEIPISMLNSVKLDNRFFSPRITISSHSVAVLGDLPRSESGRVELKVERTDRDMADKVIAAMGFAPLPTARPTPEAYWNPTQAILLIICSFLNAGFMAALLTFFAGDGHPESAVGAIIVSMLYGNIIVLQIIGGILHITNGFVFPYRAAMITALIPNTPVFLFTAPLAIWYFIDQSRMKSNAGVLPKDANSKSWGETTLIFIRENRVARWFSILNGSALVVLIVVAGIYVFGAYPTSLRYRIVGAIPEGSSAIELMEKRLVDYPDVRFKESGSNRVVVTAWARELPHIKDNLKIAKSPTLVLLAGKSDDPKDGVNEYTYRTVSDGLDTTNALVKSELGSGVSAACLSGDTKLTPEMVKEISFQSTSNLQPGMTIELTSVGRKAIGEMLKSSGGNDSKRIAGICLLLTAWFTPLLKSMH